MAETIKLWEVLPELFTALHEQLLQDYERWGDTWLTRGVDGQTERTIATFNDYFDQYLHTGKPVNWLKVIGSAFICWYREQHPELFPSKKGKE